MRDLLINEAAVARRRDIPLVANADLLERAAAEIGRLEAEVERLIRKCNRMICSAAIGDITGRQG